MLLVLLLPFVVADRLRGDAYDDLRNRWITTMVGDSSNTSDPDTAAAAAAIASTAQGYWNTLNKASGRTYLWSDAPTQYPNQNITTTYQRLQAMAEAYACPGSDLYGDANLKTDVLAGLDWVYANWYNENTPYGTQSADNNWFAWEIGAPWALENTMALMFPYLSSTQLTNYSNAIKHWVVTPTTIGTSMGQTWGITGANRAWKSEVWANLGILDKDTTILSGAASNLSPDFLYTTSGDGFYTDGSFIQHTAFPYTSGYGFGQLGSTVDLMYLLYGSAWAITDSNSANVVRWVYDSFEPNIFRNRIYDNLNGRTVTRGPSADGASSLLMIAYKLSQMTSGTDPARLDGIIKQIVQTDPDFAWSKFDPYSIKSLKSVVNDTSIAARGELDQLKFFPMMDRFSLLRPSFAFSVGMYSTTTFNYESINNENLMGWNSDDGRTTLYTNDTDQFDDYWWATVDKYRMPGITVVSRNPDNIDSPEIGSVSVTSPTASISDPLNDWSLTCAHTPGWSFDTSGTINGDPSRLVRTYDTIESMQYNLQGMTSFSVVAYCRTTKPLTASRVDATVSPDDKNWTSVALNLSAPVSVGGGWNQVTITPAGALPSGTNYVQVEFWMNDSLPGQYGDQDWVGGAVLGGKYGAAGMALHPPGETLTGLKSWFMFDNEIVALGAGIRASEGVPIETVVDSRKIDSAGDNALTVDGVVKPATLGWSETDSGVQWAHLVGNVAGSDVGYYFPTAPTINFLREARTGSLEDESHAPNTPTTPETRNYVTLWFNHGIDPGSTSPVGSYAYVLLPNMTASQTASYAANPPVKILENSENAQGVQQTASNITAVNFWNDQIYKVGGVQVNRKASILVQTVPGQQLSVALSDPTMANNGTIDVEIDQAATVGYRADPEINVYQTTPTIRFTANTSQAMGKSITAEFNLSSTPEPIVSPGMPSVVPTPTIVDALNDWSLTSSHTANLSFDTSNPSYFEGDGSRARRTTNTTESFTYAVDGALSLSFRLYYINGFSGKYAAQYSADGVNWTAIPLSNDTPVNTSGNWYRVNLFTTSNLPFGTQWIRIQLMNDSLVYSPQVGQVSITHATIPTILTDPLNDWTLAFGHTSGWQFDSSSATTYFNGDYSRLKRMADTAESVTYHDPSVLGATALVYYYGSVDGKVTADASPDNSTWTSVPVAHDTPVNTGGSWYSTTFSPSGALPAGTQYLRWTVANDSRIYTPQLGQTTLTLGSFTDTLDNFGYVLSRTANLSLDSSNPSYFENDASRLKRTTDTAESVVYAYPGATGFSFTAYTIGDFTNKLAVYSSPDGVTWTPVPVTLAPTVSTGGSWIRTIVTPSSALPSGTNYLKVQMSNDSRIYSPQVGSVTLNRS